MDKIKKIKMSELRQMIREEYRFLNEDARHEGNVVSSADVVMRYPSDWESSLVGSDDGSEAISLTKDGDDDKEIMISIRDSQYNIIVTSDSGRKYKKVVSQKVKLSNDARSDAKKFASWIKQNLPKAIKIYNGL